MDPAVFGYIRVSQAEGASGLATQRRILTGHGIRDDRIFTDVASGRNMRRPAWQQLREKLQPGDVVVVPRLDRLARNLTEGLRTIEELHAQGIHIRSLAEGLDTGDGSPTSRLMLHMLLSLAEWERETIRDRIRAGVDRAAAEGRTGGRPPALDSEKLRAVKDSWKAAGRSARPPEPSMRAGLLSGPSRTGPARGGQEKPMLTEDRPITVGDAPTDRNPEFLFIEGDRIVGRIHADCLVCTWKAGRHLYPAALLASWCGNGGQPLEPMECVIERHHR